MILDPANDNTAARAHEIGKAGEHIVCADLILQGYRAFLSDQGLPYDVLLDHGGRLFRVQVKSSLQPKNVSSAGRAERIAYTWDVRRKGKHGQSRLDECDCDLVALVALDLRCVAYFPIGVVGQCVQLCPPGHEPATKPHNRGWDGDVRSYPISSALSGDLAFYANGRRRLTHCPRGHEYTQENTRQSPTGIRCRECERDAANERNRKRRSA